MKSKWIERAVLASAAILSCAAASIGFSPSAHADVVAPADVAYPGTLKLSVDATDLDRRIFRVHEEIPVAAGQLTLNGVAAYDWAKVLRERIDAHVAPLDGLAASGWKLVYTDQPSAYQKSADMNRKADDYAASLGITVSSKDGKVGDVRWNGPAFKAGLAPTSTLVAVNGHEFKPEPPQGRGRGGEGRHGADRTAGQER